MQTEVYQEPKGKIPKIVFNWRKNFIVAARGEPYFGHRLLRDCPTADDIISNLNTKNHILGNQAVAVYTSSLNTEEAEIMEKLDLDYYSESSKIIGIFSREGYGKFGLGGDIGKLIRKDNETLFLGKMEYGEGKAIRAAYAFKTGSKIRLGYHNEVCRINHDRKIDLHTSDGVYDLVVPDKYVIASVFNKAPKEFHNNYCRSLGEILLGQPL